MTARNSQPDSSTANPPPAPELVFDYRAREQFFGFHARGERFACIVTHRPPARRWRVFRRCSARR